VEVKAVDALGKAHYAQVRSYLKATQLQRALLVNFRVSGRTFVELRPGRVSIRNDGYRGDGDVNSGAGGDTLSAFILSFLFALIFHGVERRTTYEGIRG
jgi:hypothetical protein